MQFTDIPVPEIYKQSDDFRFFLKWFTDALTRIQYDTENLPDLYDPQRCPASLLWLLGDTLGYKYDARMCSAFNRLVMRYFMNMIRQKGSQLGVTLAAEINLAQFSINNYGAEEEILYDRLEDTNIPVNSVYVTSHTQEGYIDIVYFSEEKPVDVCTEYVRPLGMYLFEHSGVRFDARTKISIDARLTNTNEIGVSIGSTHIGNYRRDEYASLQKTSLYNANIPDSSDRRSNVAYRNMDAEAPLNSMIDPGWKTLYSLQLANNEHIVNSLLPSKDKLFSIGYEPQSVETYLPESYLSNEYLTSDAYKQSKDYMQPYNLRYDQTVDSGITQDVSTIDPDRSTDVLTPRPAVNPIMTNLGDALTPVNPQ